MNPQLEKNHRLNESDHVKKNFGSVSRSIITWVRGLANSTILTNAVFPFIGIGCCILIWMLISGKSLVTTSIDDWGDKVTVTKRVGISADLPSPMETWRASMPYVVEPFAKRGELDQGILRFSWLSLKLVAQGYLIAIVLGTPIGFCLGLSRRFTMAFDPIIQILRPVSPLAWLPLGLVMFSGVKFADHSGTILFGTSDAAALFTIAICAMWPTVLNTAVGVRAVPVDYLNVAKVLKLSKSKTLFKILIPSALPYMFTGFRLSLGIAWLVIVAVEMLIGKPGVGGFLWQQYNANSFAHIILSIITIGVIGYALDRLMSMIEKRFKSI